ncbi:MAG: hypothetical protein WCG10_04445 [Chlamydiota bacterium]
MRWVGVIWLGCGILSRCFCYGIDNKDIPLSLTPPLQSYVVFMMSLLAHPKEVEVTHKKIATLFLQKTPMQQALKLIDIAYSIPPQIGMKVNVKYKKVRVTQGERPNPLLNFRARELEIVDGFEASEVVASSLRLHPHFKILGKIGLFEKWVTQLDSGEEFRYRELMYMNTTDVFTGTFKYSLGCMWEKKLEKDRHLNVEWMMEQKAHHEWKVKESLLKGHRRSGFLLDHWILNLTIGF